MDPDDALAGIDAGDLDEQLDRIATEHEEDVPLQSVRGGVTCNHRMALLHPGLRRVTCRECGCDLDAYDFLLRLSADADRHRTATTRAEHKATQAKERLDSLLREERNAKARLKRLRTP